MYNHRWEDKETLFWDIYGTLILFFVGVGVYTTFSFIADVFITLIKNFFTL